MMSLSEIERGFINKFQGDFPLEERPFIPVAAHLNCSEDSLIETVKNMKTKNILTRFGPLYDTNQLGGGLTLAAISVPENRYQIITELINIYPEVAHNYRRDHSLNMWFVLATKTPQEIDEVIHSIEQTTKLKVYNFPKQREFYIGLWLNLLDNGETTTIPVPNQTNTKNVVSIDDTDKKLINATQAGLPVEKTPYQTIADNIGITQNEVIRRLQRMLSSGVIRRIGAVPNHYQLGLTANGMTVWDVNDNNIVELGNIIGQLDFVSHCYQRPRHLPAWRYNLFAMVHGHTRDEVYKKTSQIKSHLGENCRDHEILFSSAILKKTGIRLAA